MTDALITVQRQIISPRSTRGTLSIGFDSFCTLEPPKVPAVGMVSELHPAGIYSARLYKSPEWSAKERRPYLVPLLLDVPGRTGIEIHIGNTAKDTLGCTCVGMNGAADYVGQSEDAFYRLLHHIISELTSLDSEFLVRYIDPAQ